MPIIEIDGVGKVEVDATFTKASPEEQSRIVEEIASQLKGSKPAQTPSAGPNSPQMQNKPPPAKTGIMDAASQSIDTAQELFGRGVAGVADAAGYQGVADWGRKVSQDNAAEVAASGYQRPDDVAPSVAEGWRHDGLSGASKAALYGAAESAAPAALGVGAGIAATAAAAGSGGTLIPALAAGVGAVGSGLMTAGSISKEKEEKGLDPKLSGADLGAAVVSGALDLVPIQGGGYLLKAAKGVANDALTGFLQEALQMGAVQVDGGTYVPQEIGDRLLEGAVQGGVASTGIHAAKATVQAPGAAIRGAKNSYDHAHVRDAYNTNPDQVASEMRVQKLYEDRSATVDAYGARNDQQPASVIFKSVMDDLEGNLRDTARALKESGALDKAGEDVLKNAVSVAKRHNREPGIDGQGNDYFHTEMDKVSNLGLDQNTTSTLMDALRDLNTATANSKKMNMRGPGEIWGQRLGGLAVGGLGHMAMPGIGAVAGLAGPAIGKRVGRAVDGFLGTQSPDLLRRSQARAQVAKSLGLQPGDTVQNVRGVLQAAQSRAAANKARVDGLKADFARSRADLRSKDIVPAGGFDAAIHQWTGLKPSQVDKGLAELVKRGTINQDVVNTFNTDPKALMEGMQGLTLQNRLLELVHEGIIQRDPKWSGPGSAGTPPGAPGSPAGASQAGPGIAYPHRYQAATEAYQRAVSSVMGTSSDPKFREVVFEIGDAAGRNHKRKLMEDFLATQPHTLQTLYRKQLTPLTEHGPEKLAHEP